MNPKSKPNQWTDNDRARYSVQKFFENRYGKGLHMCFPFWEKGGLPRDLIGSAKNIVKSGSPAWSSPGVNFSDESYCYTFDTLTLDIPLTFLFRTKLASAVSSMIFGNTADTINYGWFNSSSSTTYWRFNGSGNNHGWALSNPDTWQTYAAIFRDATDSDFLINGAQQTQYTNDSISQIKINAIGDGYNGSIGMAGDIDYLVIVDGAMSIKEVRDFYARGYEFLQPRISPIHFFVQGIGAASLQYKTAATEGGLTAASWTNYTAPFSSLGYAQIKTIASGGPVVIDDVALTIGVDYTLIMGDGAYTLAGQNVDLLKDSKIGISAGSYALAGSNVSLLFDRILSLVAGAYTISGQAAGLLRGLKLSIGSGSYSLSGQSVGLLKDSEIDIEAGSYSISGADISLLLDRILSVETGAYTITGAEVTLTYDQLGNYTLTISGGSYSIVGQDVNLVVDRILPIEAGSYTLTGQQASLLCSRLLEIESGTLILTGFDIDLIKDSILSAETGSYSISGQEVDLLRSLLLSVGAGSYTFTGSEASLLLSLLLSIGAGSYALTGSSVTLTYSGSVEPTGKIVITISAVEVPEITFTAAEIPEITFTAE